MLVSQIDGCIPLSVSPTALMSALDLIVTKNARIMVMGDTKPASKPPLLEPLQTESEAARLHAKRCLGRYDVWEAAHGASGDDAMIGTMYRTGVCG